MVFGMMYKSLGIEACEDYYARRKGRFDFEAVSTLVGEFMQHCTAQKVLIVDHMNCYFNIIQRLEYKEVKTL